MALAEGVVAALTVAVAVAVGVSVVPRPPRLEGERWFKAMLAAAAPSAAGALAWHPAVQRVERALGPAELAGDEDRAVIATLEALPDPDARWGWMRVGAVDRLAAAALGAEHDPRRWLGPRFGWSSVAALGVGDLSLVAEVEARCHARWVVVEGAPRADVPDVAAAWGGERLAWSVGLDDPRGRAVGAALRRLFEVGAGVAGPAAWAIAEAAARWAGAWATEVAVDGLATRLRALAPPERPEARLLVAVTGEGAPMLVRALASDMELRDRVIGVVGVGAAALGYPGCAGPTGEVACREWMEVWFRHEPLDNETFRRVPWCCVQWLRPRAGGAGGLPVANARWPAPGFVGGGRLLAPREAEVIDVIDLGALDPDAPVPPTTLAAVLRAHVALQARARG